MTTSVVVAYHSAYRGSTAALADAVARGAESLGDVRATLIRVEAVEEHWDAMHAADALVLGSPTYVGSVGAVFKAFIERLAGDVWLERMWLNKVAGGFTVSSGPSGDKLNTLQDLAIFAARLGMIWVPVRHIGGHYATTTSCDDALNRMGGYLGVMAQANIDEHPPDDLRRSQLAVGPSAHPLGPGLDGMTAQPVVRAF